MANDLIASMVLAIWLYLIAARGGFWRAAERDDEARLPLAGPSAWPAVTAVIPARDEADCVGQTVTSLLRQNYPGELTVIVVDDQSRDGTADVARGAAASIGAAERLTVLPGGPLPAGWTGKLWAQQQGVELCRQRRGAAGLSAVDRRRHRLCRGCGRESCGAGRSRAASC